MTVWGYINNKYFKSTQWPRF